ncbi:helix-turn-helix domain-containing protein [Nonomuraea wenchangensis]
MRYGQRGGYTPAEQERRERIRLQAAEWFEAGESTRTVAARLRVHERSVTRWRKAWREGGRPALLSKGPVSREKLTAAQWARLVAELRRGPLAWGYAED